MTIGVMDEQIARPVEGCSDLVSRLKRAEGQIRGVIRLLEEGQDCAVVATQMAAAARAVDKAAMALVVQLASSEGLSDEELRRLALSIA